MGFGKHLHVIEGIGLNNFRGVWHYGCNADTFILQRLDVCHQPCDHGLHLGAMVADEHQECAIWTANHFLVVGLAIDAREHEGWRIPAEIT